MNSSVAMFDDQTDDGVVLVVDDDADVRLALSGLLRSVGLAAESFACAEELFGYCFPERPTCIVLDVRLRGSSGLDLQGQLAAAGKGASIVFISGYGDVPMTAAAMKAGAVNFIAKPFRDQELLDAVNEALQRDRERRKAMVRTLHLRHRFAGLTAREQEVMQLLVHGMMNKQVADRLGISLATVKIHRGQAMRKMEAGSFAELIIMAQTLGLIAATGHGSGVATDVAASADARTGDSGDSGDSGAPR